MGYAAYAVTTGLEVGVFDADDWPLAAHYVHDIPQGARAVWKGYQTRARAQSTFDQMLQAGLVRLIDPTTGRTTVVNHRAARFRQASAPPAVLSPTGRLTPPPTPIIHSTSAPLPRRTRRERLAQTGGRENPSRVTAAPTAGSVSTSSSPPTGVTQLNRDDFSDESPRRPLASVSNIRNTRKDARTPQRQRTTPSHGVPPPPLSPSDSVSSEYAFSSPHTNASTQFGPPIRRGRDVAVPASPTPMGRDEPPSDRRKRRGAERSFREEAVNSWRQSVEVSPQAVRISSRTTRETTSSQVQSVPALVPSGIGAGRTDSRGSQTRSRSNRRMAASPRIRRDQASTRVPSRSSLTFSMPIPEISRATDAREIVLDVPTTPSSPRRRRDQSHRSTMRGTEIAASLSLESSNATSRAEPVSRESIGSRDRLLPLLLGPGVNLTPRRRASHRNATPRTTSHGPERSTRSLHSGRPLRTPQDGTLQFSEDDMMDPFDSTDVEDDARESSFAPGLSQRTESLSTIIGSSSDSPLAEGIQRTQTMPTASGDRVCDHCEGRGYISSSAPIRRTTTEQSTGREAPRSSSSAVPRRSTRTPSAGPSTSSQDSGAPVSQSRPTPSRIVRSPQRNDARVYGPNADPRSPMRTDGTSVLQNGRPVHFTRYTPPQSLAAFSASLQTPPRSQ